MAILTGRGLTKAYRQGSETRQVLAGLDAEFEAGSFTAIMGRSGSGKSTLLHLLGALDVPDAGEVSLEGTAFSAMSEDERTLLRRGSIGVVFQFFNLVPVLTVAENVALPAVIAGERPASYAQRLDAVLETVGMTEYRDKQPDELSGGQQQRAAVGRALFVQPRVLLADEPTGSLDVASGSDILDIFCRAQAEDGQTIVMVTHDPRIAGYADRILLLEEGVVTRTLDPAARLRGAARTDRSHPTRSRAVLRWLESTDSPSADSPSADDDDTDDDTDGKTVGKTNGRTNGKTNGNGTGATRRPRRASSSA